MSFAREVDNYSSRRAFQYGADGGLSICPYLDPRLIDSFINVNAFMNPQSESSLYSDIETANLKFITPRISPTRTEVADRRFGFYGGSVLTHDDGNP